MSDHGKQRHDTLRVMIGAPRPHDESARLLDLARYEILDTPHEVAFDRITRLAARLLGMPVAVINFVDQERQWGKAALGMGDTTAPRHESFCAWTILGAGPLVIEDAGADPRFADNPMVGGPGGIHTYAGVPLTTPAGHRIGTLCVTHDRPHPLGPADLQALTELGELVMTELELRLRNLELARELNAQVRRNTDLQRGLDHAQVLDGVTGLMDLELSPEEMTLAATALLGSALNADYIGLLIFEPTGVRVEGAYRAPNMPATLDEIVAESFEWRRTVTWDVRQQGQTMYVDDYPAHSGAMAAVVAGGVRQVAWLPLGTRCGVTSLLIAVRHTDNLVIRWRGSDRALLEAAGRSVRRALDRQLDMDLARQEARRDPLTGLLNRRALDQDLPQRLGQPFVLAGLDLDGLKAINDHEGHIQGDRLLQVFARTLKVSLGDGDEVYRLGGDEFVILSGAGEDPVHEAVDTAVLAARQVGPLRGASVGFAHSSEGDGHTLLSLADERMYRAKRGRQAARNDAGAPGDGRLVGQR